jgi:esterase/lipase
MKQYVELELNGHIMRGYHQDAGNEKCLVMFHGFTGHKTENHGLFRHIADELERAGISTVRFDWFGHGESDYRFEQIRVPLLQDQAKVILDYAKKHYKHVSLLGFSMGGAFAMNQVTTDIEKLCLMAPASNMAHIAEDYFRSSDEVLVDLSGFLLHYKFANGFKDMDICPVMEEYKNPVLIIQGEKDLAVPLEQTEKLHQKIPTSKLIVVKQADHCFTRHDYHLEVINHLVDFLRT